MEIVKLLQSFYNEIPEKFQSKDFLTEEDLRCKLYSFLQDKKNDNNLSVSSEIRWYGNDKKLKYRSDIVILPYTEITEELEKGSIYSKKGFTFLQYSGIIELKLRRKNVPESDAAFKEKIKNDCEKLTLISKETSVSQKELTLFILDKKGNIKNDIDNLQEEFSHIKIFYFSYKEIVP